MAPVGRLRMKNLKNIAASALAMSLYVTPSYAITILGESSITGSIIVGFLAYFFLVIPFMRINRTLGLILFLCFPGLLWLQAIMGMFNWDGTNPRHQTIFTYIRDYHISRDEETRIADIAPSWCSRDSKCPTQFINCIHHNLCEGPFAEVYVQRRKELAANPHAFDRNKRCSDSTDFFYPDMSCW